MKYSFSLLALIIAVSIQISCKNNSKPGKAVEADTAAQPVNADPAPVTETAVISMPGDGKEGVILDTTWGLINNSWSNGVRNEFTRQLTFKLGIIVEIKVTTLTKDTANSMVERMVVAIKKANKNYNVTVDEPLQLNMGTETAVNSYVWVNIAASLKPGARSTRQLEGHMIVTYSKDGKIEVDPVN